MAAFGSVDRLITATAAVTIPITPTRRRTDGTTIMMKATHTGLGVAGSGNVPRRPAVAIGGVAIVRALMTDHWLAVYVRRQMRAMRVSW